jgi:hypothetical protein
MYCLREWMAYIRRKYIGLCQHDMCLRVSPEQGGRAPSLESERRGAAAGQEQLREEL